MVTARHEALHRIFQERREFVLAALRLLGMPLPEDSGIEGLSPDCTEFKPVERFVDTVVQVSPPGSGRFVLAIESQERKDPDKRYSWTWYLSFLMGKYECPALLLVLSSNPATAKWAAEPFDLGAVGHAAVTVRPLVLGPGNTPVVADPEEAEQDLPTATLSALLHRDDAAVDAILEPLARALATMADRKAANHYMLMIEAGLGDPEREIWRNLMSTYFPGGGPLLEAREREIKAEGEAMAILRKLERRGLAVSEAVRERVTGCTDLDTLDRWFDRAYEVSDAEDLFAEDSA